MENHILFVKFFKGTPPFPKYVSSLDLLCHNNQIENKNVFQHHFGILMRLAVFSFDGLQQRLV